ncbi:hypothetical protein GCM10007052_07240 [Halioglobus japonicus]|uniref:hypothetical protein n=1 Tax=Halioglobus TaxID=1217416 RepID=UPI0012E94F09|nr:MULTISPECIES: hypothetical protein [Halioglobus]GHD09262.1 hypothetical protein GCM10007052_07240 [Halioglobus japonicus]
MASAREAKIDLYATYDGTFIALSLPGGITVHVVALDDVGNEYFNEVITMSVNFD